MGIDGPKEDLGGEARSETLEGPSNPSAYLVSLSVWRSDEWVICCRLRRESNEQFFSWPISFRGQGFR